MESCVNKMAGISEMEYLANMPTSDELLPMPFGPLTTITECFSASDNKSLNDSLFK